MLKIKLMPTTQYELIPVRLDGIKHLGNDIVFFYALATILAGLRICNSPI